MQRPSGITLTAALMVVFSLLGVVGAFTMAVPQNPNSSVSPQMVATLVHAGSILSLAISLLFVFLYWKGFSWVRWVVMVYCLFPLASLFSLAKTMRASHINGVDCILNALLAVFLLYYLNTAEVQTWFDGPKSDATA